MLLRFSLFAVIVAGAFVFDAFHKSDLDAAGHVSQPKSDDVSTDGICFYGSLNSFNLKDQGNQLSDRHRSLSNMHKLLLFSENQNTSRDAKHKSITRLVAANHSFHYKIFKRIYHRSPDDTPPA